MSPKIITSPANPDFKLFKQLTIGRGVKKHALTLVSGAKQVREILSRRPELVAEVLEKHPGSGMSLAPEMPLAELSAELFGQLDIYGAGPPLLVVKVPGLAAFDPQAPWPVGCTLFIGFQDPANVGAGLRAAAAFGVARVVMLASAASAFHHRALRVSGPAAFETPLFSGPDIAELAGITQAPLLALAKDGQDIAQAEFPEAFGLVPGLEGPGLPRALDGLARLGIPISGRVESLNAAMALGVALYQWRARLGQGPA